MTRERGREEKVRVRAQENEHRLFCVKLFHLHLPIIMIEHKFGRGKRTKEIKSKQRCIFNGSNLVWENTLII